MKYILTQHVISDINIGSRGPMRKIAASSIFSVFALCIVLFTSLTHAQELPGLNYSDSYSEKPRTTRSAGVTNPQDIVGKSDWCSYSIDQSMKSFMDDNARETYRTPVLGISGVVNRKWACGWFSTCSKGWDDVDYYVKRFLKASKSIQLELLESQKEEIEKYNEQANEENKPLKRTPTIPNQLHGGTDSNSFEYINVPLEIFSSILKYNCNLDFDTQKLEKKIDPNLTKENNKQDASYIRSYLYGLGVFHAIHYRFVEMQQHHVFYAPASAIDKDSFVYDFKQEKALKRNNR